MVSESRAEIEERIPFNRSDRNQPTGPFQRLLHFPKTRAQVNRPVTFTAHGEPMPHGPGFDVLEHPN